MRLSIDETSQLVKDNTDCHVSSGYISEIRKTIREKGRQYISLLAKNRDTYVSEYLTLIEGAKFSEGELYKLALDPKTTIQEKIAVHRELGKYKIIIAQLMGAIPIVSGLQKAELDEDGKESSEILETEL